MVSGKSVHLSEKRHQERAECTERPPVSRRPWLEETVSKQDEDHGVDDHEAPQSIGRCFVVHDALLSRSLLIMASVTAVAAMSAVHEYVHERASEQRQPNKYSEDVSAVLGKQKRASNDEKADQNETCARRQEATLRMIFVFRMIVHRHCSSPIRR